MKTLFLLPVAMLSLPGIAGAYPLYWIGTQVKGQHWAWQYSGKDSSGNPWSSSHATSASVSTAISSPFADQTAGASKDSTGWACSYLAFDDVTPDGGAVARLGQDGKNVHGIFVSSASDPIYPYMQGAVAFATPVPDSDGYVADCDTVYNAVDFPFATDGDPNSIDLERVAQQETAHCFGLHHVCEQSSGDGQPPCDGPNVDQASVMFPFAGSGPGPQHPDQRDQDNMCQIYPDNGVGRPCDPVDDSGSKGFAIPDCASGAACHCTEVGAICTVTCDASTPCPSDAACGAGGFCVPSFYPNTASIGAPTRTADTCRTAPDGGVLPPLSTPISAACAVDTDCAPGGVCLHSTGGGYCSVDCSTHACPSGSSCFQSVMQAGDRWCLSLCRLSTGTCDPSACRAGLACEYVGMGMNGACWVPCRQTSDCDPSLNPSQRCDTSSGLCYAANQQPLCNGPSFQRCDQVGCGGGQVCDSASGVCVPPGSADAGMSTEVDAGTNMSTDAGAPASGSTSGSSSVPPKASRGKSGGCGGCGNADGTLGLAILALLPMLFRRARRGA